MSVANFQNCAFLYSGAPEGEPSAEKRGPSRQQTWHMDRCNQSLSLTLLQVMFHFMLAFSVFCGLQLIVLSNTPEYAMLLMFKSFKGWRVRQVGGLASTKAFPLKPMQAFIIRLFSIPRKELWFLKPDFWKTPTSSQVFYKDWMKTCGKWDNSSASYASSHLSRLWLLLLTCSVSFDSRSMFQGLLSIKNLEKTSPTFYPKSEVQFSR